MYYEEQWVDGALCWRTSPDGAWTRYTANELAHRYESAEKRASDAQATVEALQRVRDEFERERDQLHAALMEAKAALDAEREKVKGLHEITKVICAHCCEPMEIPSKAALQTQLTQLQALMRAFFTSEDKWAVAYRELERLGYTLDATTPAVCPDCDGDGVVDSGGTDPNGNPLMRRCGCREKGGNGE